MGDLARKAKRDGGGRIQRRPSLDSTTVVSPSADVSWATVSCNGDGEADGEKEAAWDRASGISSSDSARSAMAELT